MNLLIISGQESRISLMHSNHSMPRARFKMMMMDKSEVAFRCLFTPYANEEGDDYPEMIFFDQNSANDECWQLLVKIKADKRMKAIPLFLISSTEEADQIINNITGMGKKVPGALLNQATKGNRGSIYVN